MKNEGSLGAKNSYSMNYITYINQHDMYKWTKYGAYKQIIHHEQSFWYKQILTKYWHIVECRNRHKNGRQQYWYIINH